MQYGKPAGSASARRDYISRVQTHPSGPAMPCRTRSDSALQCSAKTSKLCCLTVHARAMRTRRGGLSMGLVRRSGEGLAAPKVREKVCAWVGSSPTHQRRETSMWLVILPSCSSASTSHA